MSILEAMYQECMVVAINAPSPNFIIDNNKNRIIMKDNDINTWIKIIEKI